MVGKINVLSTIRNVLQTLSIDAPRPGQKCRFNSRNLLIVTVQALTFISASAFLLFRANSIAEFGTSFSGCVMVSTNIIYYSTNIVQIKNILKLIDHYEGFIEMSRFCHWVFFGLKNPDIQNRITTIGGDFKDLLHGIEWDDWTHLKMDLHWHGANNNHRLHS